MNTEDIVRIARENGIDWFRIPSTDQMLFEKFANAIAEAEREECAKLVEEGTFLEGVGAKTEEPMDKRIGKAIAAAIRARGNE